MAAHSGGTCVLRLHYIIGPTGSIMNMMMIYVEVDRPTVGRYTLLYSHEKETCVDYTSKPLYAIFIKCLRKLDVVHDMLLDGLA